MYKIIYQLHDNIWNIFEKNSPDVKDFKDILENMKFQDPKASFWIILLDGIIVGSSKEVRIEKINLK